LKESDDAIISTDVDSLVNIISKHKKINLNQLAKEVNMDKDVVEHWLHVLEEEGYIKLDYGITRTNVYWIGIEEYEEPPKPPEVELPKESFKFEKVPVDLDKELDMEKLSSGEPVKEAEEDDVVEDERIKEKIIEAMKDKIEDIEELDLETPELVEEVKPVRNKSRKKKIIISMDDIQEISQVSKPRSRITTKSSSIKDQVGKYLDEINMKKKGIAKLQKEKEQLYREKMLPLETKVESDLLSFTERILEKEGKILDLKERVLELPDKVEELDKLQSTAKKIEKEGLGALQSTQNKLNSLIDEVNEMKLDVEDKIAQINSTIDDEKSRFSDISSKMEESDEKATKMKNVVDDVQNKIKELNELMESVTSELSEVQDSRMSLREELEEVESIVLKREKQLEGLDEEFSEIAKVEGWVRDYTRDYEQKMNELKDYVEKSEGDLQNLRKSAEAKYLKSYLKDLEDLTTDYESELDSAIEEERSIDDKIQSAKNSLRDLVMESKQMIKKIHKDVEDIDDFDMAANKLTLASESALKKLEEKEAEREKVQEEIRRVKKLKKSPTKKNKSKPSKKSKPKKGKKKGKKKK